VAHAEVNILLVEDDVVDVKALRRAFTALKIVNPLYVASDGVEALECLRGQGNREPLPRPYVILLDINMPRMNGLEFLRELRRDAQLRDAIVFVLTTSNAHRDKMAAYQFNVAGYIIKSVHDTSCVEALRMLAHYWRIVEFPS
jgi:CheY-like chemotaxis protein